MSTPRSAALRRFMRNPTAMGGLLFLLIIAALALLAPLLYPGDPLAMEADALLWPGQDWHYPLGTDALGRDLMAGVVHGGRVSLQVGVLASLFGVVLGLSIGALAGYFGGRVDYGLQRLIEIFQTMPSFVLLVALVAIAQPSVPTLIFAIGIISWPTVARLVRAEVRSIREREYILAARSVGYTHLRIIVCEVLPNILPTLIVTASIMVASAVLMESALSFMGLGDPNQVSWGSMIGSGREQIRTAWYLTAIPGLAIFLTVLAFNLLGDGLTDALNPTLAQGRH
ncbi:ABC transporter permease [Pseudomonas sp. CCC3.1]|uniref:ABC transporter permease n=1 Tax=Pseudomonas sp. CCC3.1 TaxID=3048607 RepID=UPI002AC8BEB7|nr:ABC transporter permease [Pseudomonas sp. CCC3.1]MEB0208619.1 ABC transporter permease [Pseudomonas sp. CCC3.1]WPX38461.1 ABC transporter permease [Pseudomonas sp. CCC3.1]